MIGHRQQDGGRQMIAAADHDGRIRLGQLGQRRVRVGRLRMIDQHDADVFARHLADDLAVALEDKLLVANREMSRLAADFERAFDHMGGPCTEEGEDLPWQHHKAAHPGCGVPSLPSQLADPSYSAKLLLHRPSIVRPANPAQRDRP